MLVLQSELGRGKWQLKGNMSLSICYVAEFVVLVAHQAISNGPGDVSQVSKRPTLLILGSPEFQVHDVLRSFRVL